jgi:phosphatidylserine/phosphatidylglycerophosphate/cardiolipin synthase-like enzyme
LAKYQYQLRRAGWISLLGLISIIATVEVAAAQLPVNAACSTVGQDCLCDSSYEDCRKPLLDLIKNESVGIDVSMWFMTDWRYKDALIERWKAGKAVRVIIDLQADTNYPANKAIRDALVAAGVPLRYRTTSQGINHWKAMIFVGQNKVQFSAANFAAGSFSPEPATSPYVNYVDEAIYFTADDESPGPTTLSIVDSFKKKFDDHWIDTAAYANYANISGTPTRNYPDLATYSLHPDLNFVPYQDYENRLRTQVNYETQKIDAVMFRITSAKIPDALIARRAAGVSIRLITDEGQYRNETYFWDSYNVDRMFMAGRQMNPDGTYSCVGDQPCIDIKFKNRSLTDQDMHQKSIVLYSRTLAPTSGTNPTLPPPGRMVEFGSSNWTSKSSNGQREHNYFSMKPGMIDWFIAQFERKWNNLRADGTPIGATVFKPFVPLFPETPVYLAPANDALAQTTTPTLKWEGGWWAHKYDIYVSTSATPTSAPLYSVLDYAPGSATAGVVSTKESIVVPASAGLLPGTVYYWQVRGKTMANKTKLGPVWRFTTAGGVPAPPAPTGLTASVVSSSRIDLAWTDVAGEEGYKIERKLTSTTTWTQIAQISADVVTYMDTSGLVPGKSYNYRVRAFTSGGNSGYSNVVTATTPTPTLSPGDVVLYASKATVTGTKWTKNTTDATAAGGASMSSANLGAATVTTPLANPLDYFEMQFTATAGTAYRLWMRGKASNNNGYNDSVWIQFSNAVNGNGAPINIGSTTAEWVNLQDCSGAALNAWGWQDNGYAASPCGFLGPVIYFAESGVQTIRVQTREDGASFDQIVLSPDTYLNTSPGATKADMLILPEQDGSAGEPPPPPSPETTDVVLYASKAEVIGTAWQVVPDSTAAGGARIANTDVGAATVTTPVAEPADYFTMQFTATANAAYRLWMRGKADGNSGYNDSVWIQFSDAVNASGVPINIGTTNAEWVNLQDCSGAALNQWGWQDNGYAKSPCGFLGPLIYFTTSGVQEMRVQAREDGASFDQIVLSPSTYLNASPGAAKADTVILAEQGG